MRRSMQGGAAISRDLRSQISFLFIYLVGKVEQLAPWNACKGKMDRIIHIWMFIHKIIYMENFVKMVIFHVPFSDRSI